MANRLLELEQQLTRNKQNFGRSSAAKRPNAISLATQYSGQLQVPHEDLVKNLKKDIGSFLKNYAVTIMAANTSPTATATNKLKSKLGALLGETFQTDNIEKYGVVAELEAPLLHAHFKFYAPGRNKELFEFGVPSLHMKLDKTTTKGLPVYLIPFCGNASVGVRLPAGNEEAYAVTTLLTGCTIQISGSDQQPYVSHTNVSDPELNTPQLKQKKLTSLIDRSIDAFAQAENNAGNKKETPDHIYDPTYNRFNFGVYTKHGNYPGQTVNYNNQVIKALEHNITTYGKNWLGPKKNDALGHHRYVATMTGDGVAQIKATNQFPSTTVIGRRLNGQWTFYYQEWINAAEFTVERWNYFIGKKANKKIPLVDKKSKSKKSRTPKIYEERVVMNSGQLWPTQIKQNEEKYDQANLTLVNYINFASKK